MEEQLDKAPCSYLVMALDGTIVEMNSWMRGLHAGRNLPSHIHDLLTVPSRVFFQTYFTPAIRMHGRVEEMYLTLKRASGNVPVLMNTAERNGIYECVLVQVKVRDEYEHELLDAKRNAEKISEDTKEAYEKLRKLMERVEEKQQELVRLNEELQVMATTDALTGLKNRRYLQARLQELAEQTAAKANNLSVLLIDVDHFKQVNDVYGHPIGDEVLQELAGKLREGARKKDLIARIGGEELIAVLPHTDIKAATVIAERLRESVERGPWTHVPITVSIGVASRQLEESIASLLARADEALYDAKKQGLNRVSVK